MNAICLSATLRGALGFTLVSVAAFAVWAFGARWFHDRGGEPAMYAGCTLVFVLGTGLLLHRLVSGERSYGRFNKIFFPAFVAYALVWSVAWFKLGFGMGEWIGSALGCAVFVSVLALFFGQWQGWFSAWLVLFHSHSAGYFIGGELYYPTGHGVLPKLLWGLLYGLGFGAGIGFAFWRLQRPKPDAMLQ